MHSQPNTSVAAFARKLVFSAIVLIPFTGCETSILPGSQPTASGSGIGDSTGQGVVANDVFGNVTRQIIDETNVRTFEATLEFLGDIKVFDLGPADRGDRIIVEITGHAGLNTVAALFNGNNDVIDASDDRSFYANLLDPYINRVIRHDTKNVYLGVAISSGRHFASTQGRFAPGSFTARITRQPDQPVQDPRHQLVYLDFEGGASVQIGQEPLVKMNPFSVEKISARMAGRTEEVIALVVDHMKRDFAEYDVTLLDSRTHPRPIGQYTKIYFGNYNASYLGLADNVDTGNQFLDQEAIIYTETIGTFESLLPSMEEIAMAIANVGSHELGHLLGLEHSRDPNDCMATAASARQVLEIDASFLRSLMQSDVFPVGFQNEPQLLLWNVGRNVNASAHVKIDDLIAQEKDEVNWRDQYGVPDIEIPKCGRCSHHVVEETEE